MHSPDFLLSLVLSAFASPAMAEPTGPDEMFRIEQIDFKPDCAPNGAFQQIVDMMTGQDVDLSIIQKISGEMEHELHLDEPADWHGLKLSGIHLFFGIERGPANYSLIFDNRPEEVRAVWNKRGRRLPAVGEGRDIEELEGYAAISVSQSSGNEQGARVTCWRD